jgi:hypothetical protein
MPLEGSKSISLWSAHARVIEDYAKSLPYPPSTPQLVKRAVALTTVSGVRRLLGSAAVKDAIRVISESEEHGVTLKSVTVPDETADALSNLVDSVRKEVAAAFKSDREPSPTFCAGVVMLLFIETESPGFLEEHLAVTKHKKKELIAVE